MDNIDTGDIDLDSIAAEHQRLMHAYMAATSQSDVKDAPPKDISSKLSKFDLDIDAEKSPSIIIVPPGITRKYVHPNWVSPGLISWTEDGVMMTTILPPDLDIQKHPGVFDMEFDDLERDQEQAVACGATSWKEYFQKVDAGLTKPTPSGRVTSSGASTGAVNNQKPDNYQGLNSQDHPQYFNLTLDEILSQTDEAKALQCKNWIEYLTIKNIAKNPIDASETIRITPYEPLDKSSSETPNETNMTPTEPAHRKKLHGLFPLTGNSGVTFTSTSRDGAVDEMGAITRKKDLNSIMWDTYPDEEDPRGKVYKPSSGKNNHWESHAWPEYSEDEYDVAKYSDVEFANSGEDYSEVLDAMETKTPPVKTTDTTDTTDTKEHVVQLADRLEEAIVAIEAIYGDTKEISREVAELTPLVTDTNEDIRTLKDEILELKKRLNTRLVVVESTLKKIELSTSSLNEMMETIVKHLTNT